MAATPTIQCARSFFHSYLKETKKINNQFLTDSIPFEFTISVKKSSNTIYFTFITQKAHRIYTHILWSRRSGRNWSTVGGGGNHQPWTGNPAICRHLELILRPGFTPALSMPFALNYVVTVKGIFF